MNPTMSPIGMMPEVHQDHHICYRYALYSAPYSTCPRLTKLEVRGDSKLVKLYKGGELVKVHPRYSRGGRSTDPEDYPKELSAYALRSPNYLRQQCRKLGESVGDFADKLLEWAYAMVEAQASLQTATDG